MAQGSDVHGRFIGSRGELFFAEKWLYVLLVHKGTVVLELEADLKPVLNNVAVLRRLHSKFQGCVIFVAIISTQCTIFNYDATQRL